MTITSVFIEHFGDTFSANSGASGEKMFMFSNNVHKFDSFAMRLGMATSVSTSKKNALYQSGDNGSVLELIPAFNGALNQARYIDMEMFGPEYENERILFGQNCTMRIKDIIISQSRNTSLGPFLDALSYLDIILTQTVFDHKVPMSFLCFSLQCLLQMCPCPPPVLEHDASPPPVLEENRKSKLAVDVDPAVAQDRMGADERRAEAKHDPQRRRPVQGQRG